MLKPDILPAVRDAYSEHVADGIMSKKRMKAYFASLPGKTSVKLASDVNFDALALSGRNSSVPDLSEYTPASVRHPSAPDTSGIMKPVNVEDIEAALAELLPLVRTPTFFCAEYHLLMHLKLTFPLSSPLLRRLPGRHTLQLLSSV